MTNPNDYAFASVNDSNYKQDGLTIRQYYAGLALQGLLADAKSWNTKNTQCTPEEFARMAVVSADALILELNKH